MVGRSGARTACPPRTREVLASITPLEALAVAVAGFVAGALNAVMGSGSLITFPTLVAVGYPPVVANVSNNIGLVPGAVSAVIGYRRELDQQRARALKLALGSASGALIGGALLLTLPADVFERVVPVLVLLACALLAAQRKLTPWVEERRRRGRRDVGALAISLTFLAGIYGGYFGAAQGIILIAILGVVVPDALARTNALKNALALAVNLSATVLFLAVADVAWEVAALIGAGSMLGATVASRYGRRIPERILRPVIVVYGVGVAVYLFLR